MVSTRIFTFRSPCVLHFSPTYWKGLAWISSSFLS